MMKWLPVPGYEGLYEVSSEGQILTVRKGRLRKLSPDKNGYLMLALHKGGERKAYRVHTLVCSTFHGQKPSPELEVAHGDGVQTNNREDNVRWATRQENADDSVKHGVVKAGDDHPNVKIPDALVQVIAAEYVKGSSTQGLKALAKKYSVSIMPIHNIVRGTRKIAA